MFIGQHEGPLVASQKKNEIVNIRYLTSSGLRRAGKRQKRRRPIGAYTSSDFCAVTELKLLLHFRERVSSLGRNAVITVFYTQCRQFSEMDLSEKAERILKTPNAGGGSIESEVLSYEMLHRCFGATLEKTETEIEYFPTGGSITDYTCKLDDNTLGVSVTRAWKYRGEFGQEDAEKLLTKKLKGIVNATRNVVERWHKQILHIWTNSKETAKLLRTEYKKLSKDIVSDTVVLITVVNSPVTLFSSKNI